jgi:hypothetical protein
MKISLITNGKQLADYKNYVKEYIKHYKKAKGMKYHEHYIRI